MNFTELGFWPRLLAGLILIVLGRFLWVKNEQQQSVYDRVTLCILSLYLLSCVSTLTSIIFAAAFTITWVLVWLMFKLPEEKRKYLLWVGIPLLTAPLLYYKYRIFFVHEVLGRKDVIFTQIAIPAGISFYTFQKIGMLMDALKVKTWKPKFLDYANFASFFPQVVAGPIERKNDLFPQMESFRFRFSWENLDQGIRWVVLGFVYKIVIADNLSPFIQINAMDSAWPVLLTTFFFGLKIYFDFCGYSLIAFGLACALGVKLTLNFKSPYASLSIREFWRNWHITLSYWFRDYIYIPLGGGKVAHWWLNLMLVFIISGIWHGAGWGFVIWGVLHGLFSLISHVCKKKMELPWWLGWLLTMACVFFAWLPFYETRLNVLIEKMQLLCTPGAYNLTLAKTYMMSFGKGDLIVLMVVTCMAVGALALEMLVRWRRLADYAYGIRYLATAVGILLVIFLGATESNEFVYFSF